tara:strand:- start:278 stop:1048 length:771 start_codon:yes stop_codon:yes gene_type:complete
MYKVIFTIGIICLGLILLKRIYIIDTYSDIYIPHKIIITTPNKDTVPQYIWDQYDKYASEYKLSIYNDDDCRQFLLQHYDSSFEKKFNELKKGAHKADLFRYAYLYIHGGVYLDVKTKLNRPLRTIFRHDVNKCYLVKSVVKNTIYNGIIATPPKNPYMRQLLYQMLKRKDFEDYLINTKDAYTLLKNQLVSKDEIQSGLNRSSINEISVFEVFEEKTNSSCGGILDRYNLCVAIYDNKDNILFFTRDPNYNKTWI